MTRAACPDAREQVILGKLRLHPARGKDIVVEGVDRP
jgi:hypothetical protein